MYTDTLCGLLTSLRRGGEHHSIKWIQFEYVRLQKLSQIPACGYTIMIYHALQVPTDSTSLVGNPPIRFVQFLLLFVLERAKQASPRDISGVHTNVCTMSRMQDSQWCQHDVEFAKNSLLSAPVSKSEVLHSQKCEATFFGASKSQLISATHQNNRELNFQLILQKTHNTDQARGLRNVTMTLTLTHSNEFGFAFDC